MGKKREGQHVEKELKDKEGCGELLRNRKQGSKEDSRWKPEYRRISRGKAKISAPKFTTEKLVGRVFFNVGCGVFDSQRDS